MRSETTDSPKPGRWIARPRKARWTVPIFLLVGFLVQFPDWDGLVHGDGSLGARFLAKVLKYGVFVLVMVAVLWIEARRERRAQKDAETLLDGGFGDQFPADVTIVVEGRRLGKDRGVVWFADGLMGFSGRAASFVLAPEDVLPPVAYRRENGRARSMPPNAILLRDAPRSAYVLVTPLGVRAVAYRKRLRAFMPGNRATESERLRRYVMASDSALGERQWPPLEPYRAEAETRVRA